MNASHEGVGSPHGRDLTPVVRGVGSMVPPFPFNTRIGGEAPQSTQRSVNSLSNPVSGHPHAVQSSQAAAGPEGSTRHIVQPMAAAGQRPMSSSTISLESPKWFRVRGVAREPGPWKLRHSSDALKNASAVSGDSPDFIRTKAVPVARGVLAIAQRPEIFEVVPSAGQTLRGLDRDQRPTPAREIGDPRAEVVCTNTAPKAESISSMFERQHLNVVEVFKMFDDDGSGSITVPEFETGLHSLQQKGLIGALSTDQTKALTRELDEDGSGVIDFSEFFHRYGKGQAAGALVRRHKYGSVSERFP